MKQITVDVPDWIDEKDIKDAIYSLIKEKTTKKIILEKINEISEKLNLTEKDIEDFEKSREEAWRILKEKYIKEGIIVRE